MSRSALKGLQAAAGAAGGDPVYVDDVFSTFLYDGNGGTQSINNGIDLSGEGGLVWAKARGNGRHQLYDTERGVLKALRSASSDAQTSNADLTSFNSDGFSLGLNDGHTNANGDDYVSWTFRKQAGFFDVVTYTGNGGSNRAISHNLDSKPGLVIIKATGMSAGWMVGAGFTSTQYYRLALESSGAASGGGLANYNNYLSAEPTTTTFSVGNEGLGNSNGQAYVAYLFANDDQRFGTDSDEAAIKVGTYTGNGSSSGPTIDLGFEPQWLMIKSATSSQEWFILDSMRGVVTGGNDAYLQADTSAAEGSYDLLEFTSTGFNITTTSGWANSSSTDYIYMAIRRPHKPASEFAATQLLGLDKPTSGNKITPGFPADFGFTKNTTGSGAWYVGARLMQGFHNDFSNTNAESTHGNYAWDSMTQFFTGYTWADYMSYGFRRAPGFFDVSTFTGTGLDFNPVKHNLGVVPEMFWVKRRDGTSYGGVYHKDTENFISNTYKKVLFLDSNAASGSHSAFKIDTVTATQIAISNQYQLNENGGKYVVYFFATVPGISKVGSYTGTGSDLTVNCGFSAGARFVLVKRTDSTGHWYLMDTVQGITVGNDPAFQVDEPNAPSSREWLKPDSSGFIASDYFLTINGASYIFLAIA